MDCWMKEHKKTTKWKRSKIRCGIQRTWQIRNKNVDLARACDGSFYVGSFFLYHFRSLIFTRYHRFFIKRIMLKLYIYAEVVWRFIFPILSLNPFHSSCSSSTSSSGRAKSEQCFALHLPWSIFAPSFRCSSPNLLRVDCYFYLEFILTFRTAFSTCTVLDRKNCVTFDYNFISLFFVSFFFFILKLQQQIENYFVLVFYFDI